jgi:DNA-binding NtrC family response regulator
VRSPRRLLVVDDDPGFARALQILLEDEAHCSVAVAHSGEEALEALEGGAAVGVVITDLVMTGMSGLELLQRLRRRCPAPAVLVVTAHSSASAAREAHELGAFRFLTKPIDPGQLLTDVERAFDD